MKTALYIIGILALGWSVFIILNTTLLTWFGQDLAMMAVEDFYSLAIAQALLIPIFLYLGWVARKRIYLEDAQKILEAHRNRAFDQTWDLRQEGPFSYPEGSKAARLDQQIRQQPYQVEGEWVYPISYTGPKPPALVSFEDWQKQKEGRA